MMTSDRFYKNSFILVVSNLVTGMISFAFSIVLSRILGTEGIGLYGIIMPVYSLLICIACDGIITAVSKNSALLHDKKGYTNNYRLVETVLTYIFIWAAILVLIVFFTSPFISSFMVRDIRSLGSIRVLCPALLFVALSAVLKGYFYGTGKFKFPALVDVFEKSMRIIILLCVEGFLSPHDIEAAITAACLALAIGESISFSILFTYYKLSSKRSYTFVLPNQNRLQLLANTLVISVPLCINGVLTSILATLTALLLPRRLVSTGIPYNEALSMIGKFLGMSLNITFFPIVILSSVVTVLIPDLTQSLGRKNYWAAESRILQVLKLSCMIGMANLIIDLCIPDLLGKLIYSRTDLGGYIKLICIPAFISFLSFPTFGILNGLGKQNILLRNSLIVGFEELVLTFILTGIPALNIYGCAITMTVISLTALVLNLQEIKKVCSLKAMFSNAMVYLFTGIVSYIALRILTGMITDSFMLIKVLAIGLAGFLLVYFVSSFSSKLIMD